MKLLIAFFMTIGTFASSFSLAEGGVKNPLIRVCHQFEGRFWVLPNGQDDFPLCVFDNRAAISAVDFVNNQQGLPLSNALTAFSKSLGDCSSQGGRVETQLDSNKNSWDLCVFNDGSFIENQTLSKGKNHPDNYHLVAVLKF